MSSESPEVERPGAELGRILSSAEWLPPGTRVDRWEVVGRLGAGGYGTTYSVRRAGRRRGQLYALKLSRRPGERWFAREVALLARVRHRAVVRLVTHGVWRLGPVEHPYLVMEYVDGESLYDWALARNPTARQVARLLVQVLEALAAAHREGALHRDFKGDNVLVAADGKVKLLDWGAGWYAGAPSLTATAQLPPGSPRYYSPQLFRWRALAERRPGETEPYRYTIPDELYAVGVTFYHLLTDQYPAIQWLAPLDPLSPHGLHPLKELNPRLPEVLESVVLRLLAFSPEHRPEGAAVLAVEVRRALAVADTAWDAPLFDWREPTSSGSRTTFEAAEVRGPVMPGQEVALREARARHVEEVHRWRAARELRQRDPEKVAAAEARSLGAIRRSGTSWSSHTLRRGGLVVLLVGALVAGLTLWRPWRGSSMPVQLMAPRAGLDQARAPLTGTPPLSSPQQEKEDMSIRAPRQAAVVSPAGRSQALKRCSLVGAAALAACTGSQVRPDPSRCPDGALEAMRELHMGEGGSGDIYTDVNQPGAASDELLVRDGPIVSMVNNRFGELPEGTLLHGRLWTGGPQVTGRYTRAELPDRRSYPVCLVFGNIDGFPREPSQPPGTVGRAASFLVVHSFP
ncbi:MAG: serine/threonine protein kinase [Myxococcaceae bacterium]|nr:MAG: serine/threonine protein kinase [Myxococcaceae bacterium]